MRNERTHTHPGTDAGCSRCGGLLVADWTADMAWTGWRCVLCGHRTDQLIEAHREGCEKSDPRERVEGPRAVKSAA